MNRALLLTMVLSGVWLLWSGHYETLTVSLGAASIVFVVWLCSRMKIVDQEGVPTGMKHGRVLAYLPWLAFEIVKANFDVARRILTPGNPRISPRMIESPASQRTEIGQVVYANSITLTPGTVTVDVRGGKVLVHALHADAAAGVESGEMNRRCQALERSSS